jgi:hypothetical protein
MGHQQQEKERRAEVAQEVLAVMHQHMEEGPDDKSPTHSRQSEDTDASFQRMLLSNHQGGNMGMMLPPGDKGKG